MKRCFLFLLFFPFLTKAQELKLSGEISGLADGSFVLLTDANKPSDTLARAKVANGKFSLKTKLKEPTLVNLSLAPGKNIVTFLENSVVKMTGDIAAMDKITVSGSQSYNDFNEFQKTFNPFFERLAKNNQQMQMKGQTNELIIRSTSISDSIQREVDAFINKHASSPVSAFLITVTLQLNEDITATDQRFSRLKPGALNNLYGDYLKKVIADKKATAVGSVAMDFTQADTLGNPVSLSSFRGKYVLLDFWASWCGPCRNENPNVVYNFKKFRDKNFTVLGVSLDRPGQKERWLQAIHDDNLTWTHVSDLKFWSNAVAQQYKVESIPQNFLIDPNGKIIAKNLRGNDLEQKLCEIFGCN